MSSIFLLIKEIRKLIDSKQGTVRILVHCSLGAGRCGTFVTLFYLMEIVDQQIEYYKHIKAEGKTETNFDDIQIDVFNILFKLTKERQEMVRVYFHILDKTIFI